MTYVQSMSNPFFILVKINDKPVRCSYSIPNSKCGCVDDCGFASLLGADCRGRNSQSTNAKQFYLLFFRIDVVARLFIYISMRLNRYLLRLPSTSSKRMRILYLPYFCILIYLIDRRSPITSNMLTDEARGGIWYLVQLFAYIQLVLTSADSGDVMVRYNIHKLLEFII